MLCHAGGKRAKRVLSGHGSHRGVLWRAARGMQSRRFYERKREWFLRVYRFDHCAVRGPLFTHVWTQHGQCREGRPFSPGRATTAPAFFAWPVRDES
jgi:hypothetical protein